MTTLLETITTKAEASFGKSVTKENYNEWYKHWIKTGEQWESELRIEGLIKTASAVKEHIDFARKTYK